MTFVQMEYIVAIDTYRHFAIAAGHCFITQPTLSMQVQKLEEELGVQIFLRNSPVTTTESGRLVVTQAQKILSEAQLLLELVQEEKNIISGKLKIAIIPTLAPYLLPQFLQVSLGATPFGAGLRLLPWTSTLFVTAPIAGSVVSRFSERPLVVTGVLMQAIGLGWIALVASPGVSYAALVAPLVLAGVGVSMAMPRLPGESGLFASMARPESVSSLGLATHFAP